MSPERAQPFPAATLSQTFTLRFHRTCENGSDLHPLTVRVWDARAQQQCSRLPRKHERAIFFLNFTHPWRYLTVPSFSSQLVVLHSPSCLQAMRGYSKPMSFRDDSSLLFCLLCEETQKRTAVDHRGETKNGRWVGSVHPPSAPSICLSQTRRQSNGEGAPDTIFRPFSSVARRDASCCCADDQKTIKSLKFPENCTLIYFIGW